MNYLIEFLNAMVELMENNPHILPAEWKIVDNTIHVKAIVRNNKNALSHTAKIFLKAPKVREQIKATVAEIEEALNVNVDKGKMLSYVVIDECKEPTGKEGESDSNSAHTG